MPRPTARLSLRPLEDRLTPAGGVLDPTFGTGGRATLPSGSSVITSITSQADGAVLRLTPAVSALAVTRLTADGRLDTGFGTNGLASVPVSSDQPGESVTAVAVASAPGGRVVLAGIDGSGRGLLLARLTADGRPDPAFGTNGVTRVPLTDGTAAPTFFNGPTPISLTVLPDGRVVAATSVQSGDVQASTYRQTAFAVRLTADGRPDAGFGSGGTAVVRPDGLDAQVNALAALPDGRVVLAGTFGDGAGVRVGLPNTYAAVRLTAAGQLDPTFGTGGKLPAPDPQASITAVDVRADGTTLLAGGRITDASRTGTVYQPVVVLVRADGSRDPSFAGGLVLAVGGDRLGQPAEVGFTQDGGAVLVIAPAVNLVGNGPPATVIRLRPDGTQDPAYGTSGVAVDGFRFAVQPNGQVLAAGESSVVRLTGDPRPAAGSLLVGGTPDGTARLLAPGGDAAGVGVQAFPGFSGTARTALADVTGDGVPDLVVGAGPGGGPNVQVFDGRTGSNVANLDVFEATFTGGVFVAAADLTGDGKAEVVVTPDRGGGPVVAVYDGAALAAGRDGQAQLGRFFGIDDPAFRGGARAALGDVTGDGTPDLVAAAGFGGGPRLAVFDGKSVRDPAGWAGPAGRAAPRKPVGDFFVFEDTLRNGVYVAAGDLDGDGKAEVVVGGGPGGGPRVQALGGADLVAGGRLTKVADFFAGDPAARGGVRVAVRPDAAGAPQLVAGSGEGQPAQVRVYSAAAARRGGPADQTLAPFGGATLADGVFVG